MNDNKNVVFYPYVNTDEEKNALDRFVAGEPIETADDQMIMDLATSIEPISPFAMELYARCWDRYNPLYNNYEYAKQTWYGNIPMIPASLEVSARAALPKELGDIAYPSTEPLIGDGYDHELFFYAPTYAGDSFEIKMGKNNYVDITPQGGSTLRSFIMICEAEVYNQRKELVAKAKMHWPEFRKKQLCTTDVGKDLRVQNPLPKDDYIRPPHKYTPDDWKYIENIWNNEKIRGSNTLYWEDVSIGDEPTWTAEAPMTAIDMIRLHAFTIMEGSIMGGSLVGGIPLREWLEQHIGPYARMSDGTIHSAMEKHFGGDRPEFYNVTGRNQIIRMVTNWCGDDGFVTKVAWRMINEAPPDKQINHFPEDYFRPSYLLQVPYLKAAGKFMNTHGRCPDCSIVKGYVYKKWADTNGHYVELACWCEDLDGNIHTEASVAVRLPAKR